MTIIHPVQFMGADRLKAIGGLLGLAGAVVLLAACGTDFVERSAVGSQIDTPVAQPTVFRVIAVTPVATSTPLPPAIGPDGSVQRVFPSEIDPSRTRVGLPGDAVIGFWAEYLSGTRLIVEGRLVDVHLCPDGSLFPGSPSTFVNAGSWGLRVSAGEWYEIILGREFRAGRISGFVTLSRIGAATVAINDGLAVVSVTESDLCGEIGAL